MKTKDFFSSLRTEYKRSPSLRARLTLFVAGEVVFCILLAWLFDFLVGDTFFGQWEWIFIVELLVISLVVGSICTSYVSKYFFDPIKNLRQAMAKVADGDFSVRLETRSTSNEIREVYSGFNIMAQELNSTEILQSDFVSNVSHEFKTPINAIEGYTTLLQSTDNIDEIENEYIEKILFNTKRLSALVNNILLLSKIENQTINTNQTKFRLDEQIRQSIVALEPAWEIKNIEFDVDMESIEYFGNENLLIHVWNNIIGNAIKFNPEKGLVKIRLFKKEGRIICTIEDQGPGISDESKKHLFDKFYQEDSSHKEEGNGLGLALVKRILTISNGEISVNNTAQGCVFTVIL